MNCPQCNSKLKTVNSRSTAMGTQTWRRKHCLKCELTLTSKEVLDLSKLITIGGAPYSRYKLAEMLQKWMSKRTEDDLFSVVDTVEQRLLTEQRRARDAFISNEVYLDIIGAVLNKIDTSAAMRMQADIQED